jgi:16S rRNA (cytosine967-C5)-methyltransferase
LKPKPLAPTARTVAAAALVRVWKDSAFAAAALDSELTRAAQLDGRDAALATELVLGTLRVVPWLEARIDAHARRGTKTLDSLVRAHFVLAAYQLFFLERVPSFAAVSEAVGAIRALRGREVAAFANAVLRKLAAEAEAQRPSFAEAVTMSAPPWLRAALGEALTPEGAGAFLAAGAEPPWTGLRVENVADRDTWLARLKEAAPNGTFEASKLSPGAILARGAGRLPSLPGYAEGAWTVQEEGSQLVGLAVGAQPGERVLDAVATRQRSSRGPSEAPAPSMRRISTRRSSIGSLSSSGASASRRGRRSPSIGRRAPGQRSRATTARSSTRHAPG